MVSVPIQCRWPGRELLVTVHSAWAVFGFLPLCCQLFRIRRFGGPSHLPGQTLFLTESVFASTKRRCGDRELNISCENKSTIAFENFFINNRQASSSLSLPNPYHFKRLIFTNNSGTPPSNPSLPAPTYFFSSTFFFSSPSCRRALQPSLAMLDQMANEIKLISGSSHPELSALVANRYVSQDGR